MEASIIPSRGQEDLKSSQIEMQHFWQFKLLPSNWRGNKWHIQTVGGSVPYSQTTPNMLFSHSVASDSLWPHELWHTRPPCPSPAPGVYSNSCPLNRWCHQTISSSAVPFSSCLQSFLASGSFQISQFFTLGGWSIGVSASASVLPMNIQGLFPLGVTGLTSLHPRTLKSLLQHHSLKASIIQCSTFFMVQLSHPYMTTGKTRALTIQTFVSKMMSLLSDTLSRFVITFLPRSKHLLIS